MFRCYRGSDGEVRSEADKYAKEIINNLEDKMKKAAAELNFEAAAELRDKLIELKKHLNETE